MPALAVLALLTAILWTAHRRRRARRLILRALMQRHGKPSGYELGELTGLPVGAVYGALYVLEDERSIVGEWTRQPAGRLRRVYTITPSGVLAFRRLAP
jgi:DNA-binding PadR family transcriptional regulator